MAIPAPDKFIDPVLQQLVANGQTLTSEKMHDPIAKKFGLTKDDLALMQRSGSPVFVNYVAFALKGLVQEKAILCLRREPGQGSRKTTGVYCLTPKGEEMARGAVRDRPASGQ